LHYNYNSLTGKIALTILLQLNRDDARLFSAEGLGAPVLVFNMHAL